MYIRIRIPRWKPSVPTRFAVSCRRKLPNRDWQLQLRLRRRLEFRRSFSGFGFGESFKLLMNDRDMTVEQMESESGLSVSTVKRLRAGQDASVEQIVAISVALHLPPPVSGDLLRMCGITLDFNNQKNTVYQMILTEYYKEGIEQVNVCLEACGCAKLKTAC